MVKQLRRRKWNWFGLWQWDHIGHYKAQEQMATKSHPKHLKKESEERNAMKGFRYSWRKKEAGSSTKQTQLMSISFAVAVFLCWILQDCPFVPFLRL